MSNSWHNKPDFLALRKKWYAKLAADGFKDMEIIDWRTGESKEVLAPNAVTRHKILHTYGQSWPLVEDFFRAARAHVHVIELEPHPEDLKEAFYIFAHEGLSYHAISRRMAPKSTYFRRRISRFVKQQVPRFWSTR